MTEIARFETVLQTLNSDSQALTSLPNSSEQLTQQVSAQLSSLDESYQSLASTANQIKVSHSNSCVLQKRPCKSSIKYICIAFVPTYPVVLQGLVKTYLLWQPQFENYLSCKNIQHQS